MSISKKSGGMVYRKPGTTKDDSLLVRVMHGNAQTRGKPYVVQRRGKNAVASDGSAVGKGQPEAHIPLSEYKFKGW